MIVKKKLKCILLVDDDEATNYYHNMVIMNADIADMVHVSYNGKDALDYLITKSTGTDDRSEQYLKPDIILLDINMPRVNGWEFLEEYRKLKDHAKAGVVIIMLTTSFNPDDELMAKKISEVAGFNHKPLDEVMLEQIIRQYFPDHIE